MQQTPDSNNPTALPELETDSCFVPFLVRIFSASPFPYLDPLSPCRKEYWDEATKQGVGQVFGRVNERISFFPLLCFPPFACVSCFVLCTFSWSGLFTSIYRRYWQQIGHTLSFTIFSKRDPLPGKEGKGGGVRRFGNTRSLSTRTVDTHIDTSPY